MIIKAPLFFTPLGLWILLLVLLPTHGLLFAAATNEKASAAKTIRFNGGMYFQSGYFSLVTTAGAVAGVPTGLGGKLSLSLLPWLRVGGMGSVNTLEYHQGGLAGSYWNLSAGGLTVELTHAPKAFRFSLGGLFGGGAIRQLHLLSEGSGLYTARYDRLAGFLAAPYLGIEWRFAEVLAALLLIDWPMGPLFGPAAHAGGPRIALGILFNR